MRQSNWRIAKSKKNLKIKKWNLGGTSSIE
jgi:hypothetical protein